MFHVFSISVSFRFIRQSAGLNTTQSQVLINCMLFDDEKQSCQETFIARKVGGVILEIWSKIWGDPH